MVRHVLSKLKLKIGALLGNASKKEKDVVDAWKEMCNQMGVKVIDRVVELLEWDLMNQGVDLSAVKAVSRDQRINEALSNIDLARYLNDLAVQFGKQQIITQQQAAEEMFRLINYWKQREMTRLLGEETAKNILVSNQNPPPTQSVTNIIPKKLQKMPKETTEIAEGKLKKKSKKEE